MRAAVSRGSGLYRRPRFLRVSEVSSAAASSATASSAGASSAATSAAASFLAGLGSLFGCLCLLRLHCRADWLGHQLNEPVGWSLRTSSDAGVAAVAVCD